MTTNTRKKTSRKNTKKGHALAWTIAAVCALLLAGGLCAFASLSGSAPSSAVIKIPSHATPDQVTDSLTKYLGKGFAGKVMRLASMRGTDFSRRHGAYLIEAGDSPLSAMRRITSGAQNPVTLTIKGFRQLPVLEEKVAAKFEFSADSLASLLADPATLRPYGLTPLQAIALFINDSYDFYWSASPQDIVDKIGAHYNEVWNDSRRAKAKALGLTPADVMTIASITDEETNALDEKGTVGRLYINRLNIGMPLQADPTVRYAVGDFTIRRVTGKHLQTDSPYNTYRNRGLPPGPIRTTSVETIDAILDSPPHDFLYMCAKEDFSGRHNFAVSYSEHQANARRYQQALDRLGINK